jgi:hypothetical protein
VELAVKGRLKELWKPIIQIVAGLTVEQDLRVQLERSQKERLDEKLNTLEGHIVKVVCSLYVAGQPLLFGDLWDALVKDLDGKLDENKPNKMDTPEFGVVTKQKIGYRLREVLSGKKDKVKKQSDRAYFFDALKLGRLAKKYGCLFGQDKQDNWTSSQAPQAQKPERQVPEDGTFSQNKLDLGSEKTENQAQTASEVVRSSCLSCQWDLDDLALKAKSVYRLTMDFGIETCVVCNHKGRADWQVTLFDDSWGFLCGLCGLKLSERLNKNGG